MGTNRGSGPDSAFACVGLAPSFPLTVQLPFYMYAFIWYTSFCCSFCCPHYGYSFRTSWYTVIQV